MTIGAGVLLSITLSNAEPFQSQQREEGPFGGVLDSIQQKKVLFRKEYKERLDLLEGKIAETRAQIKTQKPSLQAQLDKDLNMLDQSRKNLLAKLESLETEEDGNWERFAQEVREEYDETESKLRNFFKNNHQVK